MNKQTGITFIVGGDTHVAAPEHGQWLQDDLARIARAEPEAEFIVLCGDLTENGSRLQFQYYLQAIENSEIPVWSVYGGHDGVIDKNFFTGDAVADFKEMIGPLWWHRKVNGFSFIALTGEYQYATGNRVLGINDQDVHLQTQWFAEQQQKQNVADPVLFMHVPPRTHGIDSHYYSCGVEASPDFLSQGFKARAVIHAHRHIFKHYEQNGIPMFAAPPLLFTGYSGTPRGYLAVTMSAGKLSIRHKTLPPPDQASPPLISSRHVRRPESKLNISVNWPDFYGGDSGRIRSDGPLGPLTIAWQCTLSGSVLWNSPVAVAGQAVVATGSNDDCAGAAVNCVDLTSGQMQWQHFLSAPVPHTPVMAPSAGLVVVLQTDGTMLALNLQDGRELWRVTEDAGPHRWTGHAPAISGNHVFLPTPEAMKTYSLEKGELRWRTEWKHEDNHSPPTIPLCIKNKLFAATHGDGIYCFNTDNGAIQWKTDADGRMAFCNTPFGYDFNRGLLYGTGEAGDFCALQGNSGDFLWSVATGRKPLLKSLSENGSLAVGNLVISGGANVPGFTARNADTGRLLWERRTGPAMAGSFPYLREEPGAASTPAAGGDLVYAGANDGCIYSLRLNDGSIVSKVQLTAPISSSPILAGRYLLVTSGSSLFCLKSEPAESTHFHSLYNSI